jgi:hypothetical protein
VSVVGCLDVDCMCRLSGAWLLIACVGCRWLFLVPGCRLSGAWLFIACVGCRWLFLVPGCRVLGC